MSNINNQTKTLNGIAEVQDVSDETAAAIQGSAALEVYKHTHTLFGHLGSFNLRSGPRLSKGADNEISRIEIAPAGGQWNFYSLPNYKGEVLTLGEGTHIFSKGDLWNDRISSFDKIDGLGPS